MKLKQSPYAQADIRIVGEYPNVTAILRSYETDVLWVDLSSINTFPGVTIKCPPIMYSRTTGRHIATFTKEMFGVNLYHEIKHNLNTTVTLFDILPNLNAHKALLAAAQYVIERGHL